MSPFDSQKGYDKGEHHIREIGGVHVDAAKFFAQPEVQRRQDEMVHKSPVITLPG